VLVVEAMPRYNSNKALAKKALFLQQVALPVYAEL
jgi:hypothetical protein